MRENFMAKPTDIMLKPLYLSEEEEEIKKFEYKKIISKYFPNMHKLTQKEFKQLLSNIDKTENLMILKNFAFKCMSEQVEYIYLHYCVKGYDFEDMLLDMYILIEEKLYQYLNAEFVSGFKFFIDRFTFREVMAKLNKNSKKNIDIFQYNNDQLCEDINIDEIIASQANIQEVDLLKKDFGRDIEKYINKLNPRYQELLTLYFGLKNTPTLKMHEIAEKFNITKSMVQRHISNALIKLEKLKNEEYLKDYKDGFEF